MQKTKQQGKSKTVKIVLAILATLTIIDISPLGGNIPFYIKWVQCSSRPVQTASWGGIAWYEQSPIYQPLLRNKSLYCTPVEAERAGYSADKNQYDFPHLREVGEPTPFMKKFQETHSAE